MKFISLNRIAIAEKFKVFVYDFSKSRSYNIYISSLPIIGILQTSRNKCAILQEEGKITICDMVIT